MRTRVPIAICFVMGVVMFVQFFVPHPLSEALREEMMVWARLVAGFALALGIGSLISVHVQKIRRRATDRPYSAIALVCLGVMAVLGIVFGTDKGPFKWLFDNVYMPLDATMFALLGFFIASAAYRTFRARTVEATLLLVVAVVMMLGRVPVTGLLHERLPDWLSEATDWLLNVPNMAQKRGIMLGVALGAISMSLRIILGIERVPPKR
jgi:nitrate reductase gamma subunit